MDVTEQTAVTTISFISSPDIDHLLRTYGYLIFLPVAIIEGPIVTVIAGFLTSIGYFSFWLIYALAVAADLIGDVGYYMIGRWGRKTIYQKGKFFRITRERLERSESFYRRNAGKVLLFGKWTHSMGAIILTMAGMVRLSMRIFLFYNFIGTVPKVLIFLLIGYYFGRAYQTIDRYFEYIALSLFLLIVAGAGVYLLNKKYGKEFNL